MSADLSFLCGGGHLEVSNRRAELPFIAAGASVEPPDAGLVRRRVALISEKTVCLTLLAGTGSRWVKSLRAAKADAEPRRDGTSAPAGYDEALATFPEEAPRGLYPVRNALNRKGGTIPVAAYSLDAVHGLGRHLLVVRGWEKEIDERILDRLGIDADQVDFFTQAGDFRGKPAGHGDATWQSRDYWRDSEYVVANFGGDANSPLTALSSLLALDALARAGEKVDFLMPVALAKSPAYPVRLDECGLPRAFGHNKLGGAPNDAGTGASSTSGPFAARGNAGLPAGMAYTNVGLRLYRSEALYEASKELRDLYWSAGNGYMIPGNDPDGREFALDNVDALLAAKGRARILAIARPDELTPAKAWDDIPAFETAIGAVRAEWASWILKTGYRTAP